MTRLVTTSGDVCKFQKEIMQTDCLQTETAKVKGSIARTPSVYAVGSFFVWKDIING